MNITVNDHKGQDPNHFRRKLLLRRLNRASNLLGHLQKTKAFEEHPREKEHLLNLLKAIQTQLVSDSQLGRVA